MKKVRAALSAVAMVSVLTACGGGTGPPETVLSSLSVSTPSQASSAVAGDTEAREGGPPGPEPAPVTDREQAAAMALLEQFSGTRISGLTVGEVVIAARLSCAMANPADQAFYDPAALKESMRITYIWHREESGIRFLPGMVEQFCPELHPGDEVIDELIADITSG
ncbi:hypothetical protein [Corynebacterium sp. A21]|uniref:hypothetical protein n=1 Tax=Corynebacterium sp. A21 TaxID=3457318 RepID=UPI003FD683BF